MINCNSCKIEKDIDKFFFRNKEKGIMHKICKECYRKSRKNIYPDYYQNHKEEYIARSKRNRKLTIQKNKKLLLEYLSDKKCIDCLETDLIVLEFDHLDPSIKTKEVSEMVCRGVSWARILKEILKCEIVCSNCHKRRENKRYNFYRQKWVDNREA